MIYDEEMETSLSDASDVQIRCPFCREKQWIEIDPTEGSHQQVLIDCQVCCRPIEIEASMDAGGGKFQTQVSKSSGF